MCSQKIQSDKLAEKGKSKGENKSIGWEVSGWKLIFLNLIV